MAKARHSAPRPSRGLPTGGFPYVLRALLSTLVPPRRERTVEFELPKIESAADARKASSAVIVACAAGELSPHEASQIMQLISIHVRVIEVAELDVRVAALEKKQVARKPSVLGGRSNEFASASYPD
jgi:hypothetical protein